MLRYSLTAESSEGHFEVFDTKFAPDRPRRLSNLGIDFLDDPDQRPDFEAAKYYAHHAEAYHGDKEHRNSDLEAQKRA